MSRWLSRSDGSSLVVGHTPERDLNWCPRVGVEHRRVPTPLVWYRRVTLLGQSNMARVRWEIPLPGKNSSGSSTRTVPRSVRRGPVTRSVSGVLVRAR